MDYPKSVPGVGLQHGQFVDEDAALGLIGSLIPAAWGNSLTDELLNVIRASGLEPDEKDHGQVLKAQDLIYARLDSPSFIGLPKAPTPELKEISTRLATTQYVADYVKKELLLMAVGQVGYFAMEKAPDGWLKLNGACVLRSLYSRLDKEIYCGDKANPTAHWSYRCVDSQQPNETRSINGDYLVLPDFRGLFLRCLDDGRGIDLNRSLWDEQSDLLKKHGHPTSQLPHGHAIDEPPHDHEYIKSGGGYGHGGDMPTCFADNFPARTSMGRAGVSVKENTIHIEILETGGNETRPRNATVIACVKY